MTSDVDVDLADKLDRDNDGQMDDVEVGSLRDKVVLLSQVRWKLVDRKAHLQYYFKSNHCVAANTGTYFGKLLTTNVV